MLRIGLDVQSGTNYVVVPKKSKGSYIDKFKLAHNPDNRHKFLQGLLLALMGERVSLYALDRADMCMEWEQATGKLKEFIDKVDIKGNLNEHRGNFHLGLFEQHRKHDAVKHTGYIVDDGIVQKTDENISRLNLAYSPFIEAGLFDMFLVQPDKVDTSMLKKDRKSALSVLKAAINETLNSDTHFDGEFINAEGINIFCDKLDSVFLNALDPKSAASSGDNIYSTIMDMLEANDFISKQLNKENSLLNKSLMNEQEEVELNNISNTSETRILIFSCFAWHYLSMYKELLANHTGKGKANCSTFGIKSLDFKKKSTLKNLLDWLSDCSKPLKESRSLNGNSEYFKTVFNASKYNVSTSAPTLTRRYDGTFELFVKSDKETEQFIKDKITKSGCWVTRVGKLSLGRLQGQPELIPSSYWEKITDDVVNTLPLP
jgi:hypothetical protein